MEVPGLSIFQGAESIKLDASANRLEEEEALEDQRRRNEELGNQLQNAFDDLIDDDDYTVDTSANFESHFARDDAHDLQAVAEKQSPPPRQDQQFLYDPRIFQKESGQGDHKECRNEIESMKKCIESKNREIENISKLVHDERKTTDELKKRLALSEAEKERAHMTRKQTHELLVDSKAKLSEMEDSMTKLKTKVKSLEETNNNLIGELEGCKMQLSDAQHKFHLVERNAGYTADRHAENLIKQANERHVAKVEIMQQQIDSIREKFDTKENEFNGLDKRYKELQRNREALLVEKSEVINQLIRNLEDSQQHCQELMSKQDHSHENIRLQRTVQALERQTEDMQKTINNLTSRLDATTAELQLMDGVLGETEDLSETLRCLSLTKGNIVGSTPLPANDRISRLKNELFRSMAGQKEKREEIRKLQEQIAAQNNEIKKLKNDENNALIEITTYKEENLRLGNRLRLIEAELNELRTSGKSSQRELTYRENFAKELDKMKEENELITTELENAKSECAGFKEKSNELRTEVDQLCAKLKSNEEIELDRRKLIGSLEVDLEELRQENESLKKNCEAVAAENNCQLDLEKHKFLLKDAQGECERLKELYVEISQAKESLATELIKFKSSNLSRELHDVKEMCEKLKRALQLSELKCSEFGKLLALQKQSHQKELQQIRERVEKDKADSLKSAKDTSNNCTKCMEQYGELAKLEVENLKLQCELTTSRRDIEDLQREVSTARTTIADLNEKIGLKEEHDQLIAELKEKAQQFEEYIKNHNSSKDTSGVSSPKFPDQGVGTSPEFEQSHNRRKQLETHIRDEMAKIFAGKIKQADEQHQQQIYLLESQNDQLKTDLKAVFAEFQVRQQEVEVLKHAILIEREKMHEIIKSKSLEFEQVNGILQKCRDELKSKQTRIELLTRELHDRSSQIESERKSMKAVMSQWEEQRKSVDSKAEEWKATIKEMKHNHQKLTEQIQTKYESAKKTAANYKRYAEDKEKHMLQEYDRIKQGYETSLQKIELRMKDVLEKQTKEMKEKLKDIETVHQQKLNKLGDIDLRNGVL